MGMTVMKIKKSSSTTWTTLPVPISLKPAINVLDSSKSGRDNNTGSMFRDRIAEKQKFTAEIPGGLNNTQVAEMLDIILEGSFDCWLPNPKTGQFGQKTFYCTSAEPEIHQIYSTSLWDYNSFSISLTEM